MATGLMTLSEYAELVTNLADSWEGDEPIVAIGDVTGQIETSLNDGHTTFGNVGYANEVFGDDPVLQVTSGDTRFFGTMLFDPRELPDETVEQVRRVDYNTDVGNGARGDA